jgi:5S rRNA maturation endonuclease (ribonuclease M5)
MFKKEIGEDLLKIIEEIKDKTIIVEGKRDKRILCSLGIKNIVTIRKGLYETVEGLKADEVVILTDFDSEGRRIAKKLNKLLQSLGYKVDRVSRRKMGLLLTRLRIKKIEELKGCLL